MKVGNQVRETGAYPVFFESKLTKDQVMCLQKQQGRVFVLASLEWDSEKNTAQMRLDPGNGVEWQFDLTPVEE